MPLVPDIEGRRLGNFPLADLRSLYIEVPQHKGIVLPVVGMKVSRSDARAPIMYLEAACRYCNGTHRVRLREGLRSPIALAHNE